MLSLFALSAFSEEVLEIVSLVAAATEQQKELEKTLPGSFMPRPKDAAGSSSGPTLPAAEISGSQDPAADRIGERRDIGDQRITCEL